MNIQPQKNQEEKKENQNIIIQQPAKFNLGISPKIRRKTVTLIQRFLLPKFLYLTEKYTKLFV